MTDMTVFSQMARRRVGLLHKLVQRPPFAEIGVGVFTELAGLGSTSITDNFAMKMVHWGVL